MHDDEPQWYQRILVFLLAAGLLAAAGAAYYFYDQNQKSIAQLENRVDDGKDKEYVQAVSKLVILPSGEEPIVARVDDKQKFVDQPYFANAEKGDIFLVYPKAKRAYLYRPSAKKIVDVGPVDSSSSAQSTPAPSTE